MSRFINYLNEQRGRPFQTQEQAIDFVAKNCQDAVKAWFKGYRIYRGVQNSYGKYGYIKPTTERYSANTLNFYTLIINNHPIWKQYPKRQIIASTDQGDAMGYGYLYLVLPVNGAKIGICRNPDMWDSLTYKGRWADNINDQLYEMLEFYFNEILEELMPSKIDTAFNTFKKITSEITQDSKFTWHKNNIIYDNFFGSNYKNLYDFMAQEVFSPIKNKFRLQTIKNFSIFEQSEVWTDTACALISMKFVNDWEMLDFMEKSQRK